MEHTLTLIRKVHEGDKKAREQLIEENMGLVYTVVQRFLQLLAPSVVNPS